MRETNAHRLTQFLDDQGWISSRYIKMKHKPEFFIQVGDRVHLKSRNGIYTVIGFEQGISFVKLSCFRWEQLGKKPIVVSIGDIKCKPGIPGTKARRKKNIEELINLILG